MSKSRLRRLGPARGRYVALGLGLLIALATASAGSAAGGAGRFAGAPSDVAGSFTPVIAPLGLSKRPTTVVVQLAGDPVAVADANSPTQLSKEQRRAIRDQLKSKESAVEGQIRALGGSVLAEYQYAYNGVKVQIEAGKTSELASLPGVVAVRPLQTFEPSNVHGVPLVGAPQAWNGVAGVGGFRGEGVKIAIIDTGIDYTHADFGGPGTTAAYNAANATDTLPANPTLFGPAAPRVKGGIDLVGDDYNADPNDSAFQPVPHPDPNPLDCHGHGSHVAGTAAGSGVLANGSTFTGPYNANTIAANSWTVGPGVAPRADIYSVRVFGCAGSTNVTVDAIEWAVANDMDVINMSLGSPFGSADDPSAVAASNAAKAGVIVVASSGNDGPSPYMTGSPASGTGAISVAANDPTPSFPAANIAGAGSSPAINANGATFADGLTLPVKVLKTASGAISLGCNPAEYTAAGVVGKLVVTRRGTCARVARAIFGEQAGAAAVLMVNNAPGFPPFEGKITANPDDGKPFTVTIPFLGTPSTTNAAWLAADGKTVTLTNATLANPGFLKLATFTSFGPRSDDSFLKPDVTAPGVSIASVANGTGNQATVLSGTSMAAPHTTGVAALVRQAHASWGQGGEARGDDDAEETGDRQLSRFWKAAIVNTADPAGVANYTTAGSGSGLVQAQRAVLTQVIALGNSQTSTLNFGFSELRRDFQKTLKVKLRNFGGSPATFNVANTLSQGLPHSVSFDSASVTVPARGKATVKVTLTVPVGTAGSPVDFEDAAGEVLFTPAAASNSGISLRVPYYIVPQTVSEISTKLRLSGATGTATSTNRGATAGQTDWYAWGLSSPRNGALGSDDARAVGVQTFPADGVLAFAFSAFNRVSNAAENEYDVVVDTNGDGRDDFLVAGIDLGVVTSGTANGRLAVAVFNLATSAGSIQFLADAPMDSSTVVLPVLFSQLGLTAAHPRFSYRAQILSLTDGSGDVLDGSAKFNAFHPSLSTGMSDEIAPGASATENVAVDAAELAQTPALGFMVVSHSNEAGRPEADLLELDD